MGLHDRPEYYIHNRWGGMWALERNEFSLIARIVNKPVTWDEMVRIGWQEVNILDPEDRKYFRSERD